MKRIHLAAAIALAILPAAARADFEIVQKIDGAPGVPGATGPTEITIKMKGDRVRMDMSQGMSVILNTTTSEMTSIMHAQKMAMKVSGDQMKQLANQAAQQMGGQTPAGPKLVPTGKKESINGHAAEEYKLTTAPADSPTTIWIAKDFPNSRKLLEALEKLQSSSLGANNQAFNLKAAEYPGMPVRSVSIVEGKPITMTLVSATEKDVPESDLTVPDGYQVMAMPQMPAAPKPE